MIPHDLPDYVERGGRQVWRPPYSAREAEVFGFVLASDPVAVDGLIERDLVEPARGAVDYRSAHADILVLCASIGRLTSAEDPDRLRGCASELEVSVWCLATDAAAGDRLVWYLPYVFADSGQAIASGREVYGYPKQIGIFDQGYPSALAGGGTTGVEAPAIDPYGPGSAATPRPMISLTRKPSSPGSPAVLGSGGSAFADLVGHFGAGVQVSASVASGPPPSASATITPAHAPPPHGTGPAPGAPASVARRMIDRIVGASPATDPTSLVADLVGNPTLVFLKQFRDVSCPTKACYQAIVEAPLAVDPVGATYEALDPSLFELEVHEWASHPLASDLGLQAAVPLAPKAAFRAAFAFDIRLGVEVWRAPT